ncbi:HigA family addiction module antitoxin [Pelagibacterium sp. 26DY04]|uniref:HigA family addiction module antitoxin n=1 Tax=Pelagibacterium sp. 26DY04 TaxID=2967130 RepID=UPI002815F5AA|nr:HigA family addiction module antitoxin [Pelagibacterium sp. 26DY04]WMT87054.1 HigA family addiction module antitoxin [Pelagibacterium sp. 26DY04]
MSMKLPPHPGLGLKDDLDALGLTIAQGARALGVTRQQLYKLTNGDSAISPEMAIRIEQAIGGRADHWLRLQAAYDLARIRDRGTIHLDRVQPLEPAQEG